MIIGLLQLSDIHMKEGNNSILEKDHKIACAIQEYIFQIDHLFLIITGDSAFSGKESEYLHVIQMIDNLKENILSVKKIDISILSIPGNHDCYLPTLTIRDILIKNIKTGRNELSQVEVEELTKPQNEYFEFLNCYEDKSSLIFEDKLLRIYSFNLNNKKIIFNCFNSSWISEKNETPGTLYFPIDNLKIQLTQLAGDLIITAIHHPRNWYNPENGRNLSNILEKYSDLILTGHEHVSTGRKVESYDGVKVQYIEGGVLQDTDSKDISEFNFILFNLQNEMQKINKYTWKDDYYSNNFSTEWTSYYHTITSNNPNFSLSENYHDKLNDLEISLKHPRKAKILLDDVYLYPDAKLIISEKISKSENIINLEKITSYSKLNLILYGAERSGKTTFCKRIYSHFYNRSYVPVYINAIDINSYNFEDFNKIVYRNFTVQYSKDLLEKYKQLEHTKKILIIDDMEKSKLRSDILTKLLNEIKNAYPNLLITGSELLKFSDIIGIEGEQNEIFEQFEKYEILQFGHLKRSKLVEKWTYIGANNLSDNELLEKQDRIVGEINTVIGSNFVPSYPFFLLIIIQTAESDIPHSSTESAYGYYYELLITQAMINIEIQPKELDAYYTFISELAFYFYSKEIYEISDDDLRTFYSNHCYNYDLDNNYEKMATRLVGSSILERQGEFHRFKLNYIYYFFVAKYLATKITNTEIRLIIKEMCTHLHIEENSNVILFLTHLSKDPFILNSLYEKAVEIFNNFPPTKLEDDIIPLNKLVSDIPKIVYHNIEVKKHREERLIAKDEVEISRREAAPSNQQLNHKRKDSVLDAVTKLNVAFKAIELLGQILKKYYGSIDADRKYILTEEAYMIGLRTLSSFLSLVTDNVEGVANNIQRMIEQQEGSNKQHSDKQASKILFNLCCAIAYQTIIKVTESIGSKDMKTTFTKITNENNFTSVKLIEIAIKLDQLRSLPFSDIKAMKEELEKNLMATTILKFLVVNHLYMYDTTRIDKQRICELLNIPVDKQIAIDKTSTQKKHS